MNEHLIYGIGEIVVDIYYKTNRDRVNQYAYSGGGSVWNILCNLSQNGVECKGLGTVGKDRLGQVVLDQMKDLGVDCSYIHKAKNITNQIHIKIPQDQLFVNDTSISMSIKCPICGSRNWASRARYRKQPNIDLHNVKGKLALCFDTITKQNLECISKFQEHGALIVGDIGQIGYLRYKPEYIYQLSKITYLQINLKVAEFLQKRLGIKNLIDFFCKIDTEILCVTRAENGCTLLFNKEGKVERKDYAPTKKLSPVDTTGAGDAFFAGFLKCLIEHSSSDLSHENYESCLKSGQDSAERALNNLGARGHLVKLDFKNLTPASKNGHCCVVCDSSSQKESKDKFLSGKNYPTVNRLERKLSLDLEVAHPKSIARLIQLLEGKNNILFTGSGGSFPASSFAASITNTYHDKISHTCKPWDVRHINLKPYDAIFGFSYSGKSPDILAVQEMAKKYKKEFVLFTFSDEEKINHLLEPETILVSYADLFSDKTKEKSFISFAGTMLPCELFLRSIFGQYECGGTNRVNEHVKETFQFWSDFLDERPSFIHSIMESRKIDIFFDKETEASALDLESKFIETGIARVSLHEKKDFSHGRFVGLHNLPSDLIIYLNHDPEEKYEILLLNYLNEDIPDKKKIHIIPCTNSDFGSFDYMLLSNIIFKRIESVNSHYTKKPTYPVKALKLYRYV